MKKQIKLIFNNIEDNFFSRFVFTKQYLDRIKSKLDKEFLIAIKNISLSEDNNIDKKILEILKRTGFLDEDNNIRGNIIKAYCKISIKYEEEKKLEKVNNRFNDEDLLKINNLLSINKINGEILFSNKISNQYLTENELKIIKELYLKKGEYISKENIGKIIWDNNIDNYSEWAIDKLISRLRIKIEDKKPYRIILTSRNKGYLLIGD